MRPNIIAIIVWAGVLGLLPAETLADVELKVARFFDPCIEYPVSIERAAGEACIIQAIFEAFSAQDNGITVDLIPSHRESYYPQLIAAYSSGEPPDLHLVHRHRLSNFASAGMLAELTEDLSASGIDIEDWSPAARAAATIDGQLVAMPFDIHANLWHVNLALFAQAGLLGGDGRPILPVSPGELLEHASKLKEATGKDYLASDFAQFPIGARAVLSLLWQQGVNILDGDDVKVNTASMRASITTFTDLFDAGFASSSHDYESAQQAFLSGDVAVLINGTWAVDLYDRLVARGDIALSDYDVVDFPTLLGTPATWADSHLWAVPESLKADNPEAYQAALQLLAWINEHNQDWARTGHMAVRKSVLESRSYATMAHRLDYRNSAEMGQDLPIANGYDEINDTLVSALQAIWMENMSIDQALKDAEAKIEELLQP
jgi:multiple sugar transport system substrate-binding protein